MYTGRDPLLNIQLEDDSYPSGTMLPVEIVAYIMDFLSMHDRISAGQVCRIWYEASCYKNLLSCQKLVVSKSTLEQDSSVLRAIEESNKTFYHCILNDVELIRMRKFFSKSILDIKSLSLKNCVVTEKFFVEILSECKNLISLEVNDCREPLISGRLFNDRHDVIRLKKSLVNLRKLSLVNNRYLSDILFNRFISITTNLNALSLAGCFISFHSGLYNKFYPNRNVITSDNNQKSYDSESVLTFLNIMQFLSRNSEQLNSLDFSHSLITGKNLSELVQLPKLVLRKLYLKYCLQLNTTSILNLTQYQKSLMVLNLSGCSNLTDQSLMYICEGLINLKKLWLQSCSSITDVGVAELRKLLEIEVLDLSQCNKITGDGLEKGLCHEHIKIYKHLCLRSLNGVSSSSIIKLVENLKNILYLDLSYLFSAINDSSIQVILKNLVCLRYLKLANCTAITDAGLTGMQMDSADYSNMLISDNESPNKNRHYISLRSKAEEDIVRDAKIKEAVKVMCIMNPKGQEGYSLTRIKGLRQLDLSCCGRITDVSLEYAFKLVELEDLNLRGCQQITDHGLSFVAANNPSIERLNLSVCHSISDEGIKVLVKSLKRIKYLNLQDCRRLTNASLLAIKSSSSLRWLNINQCNITPNSDDLAINGLQIITNPESRE